MNDDEKSPWDKYWEEDRKAGLFFLWLFLIPIILIFVFN